MLHKFIIPMLFLTAASIMSFTTFKGAPIATEKVSNILTVTNPTAGTAVMNWSFSSASTGTYGFIIEDVVHRQVVRSGSASLTSYTATGLPPGSYHFTVTNSAGYIVVDDLVML